MHTNQLVPSDKIDIKSGEKVLKSISILDYNKNMGAVDKSDMILSTTETVRKTIKWYKKTFSHLFHITVLNASILYHQLTQLSSRTISPKFDQTTT